MGLMKEFREFALKGNVIDLAIGVIIGAAFGKVVTSMVDDVIMPPVGVLVGERDFSDYFINLSGGNYASLAEAKEAGAATLNYGLFLTNTLDFVIVALAVFLIVRRVNAWRRKPEEASPNVRDCPECLSSIPKEARRCRFCTVAV